MFEKIIKRSYYRQKHLEAPLLDERIEYIQFWANKGRSLNTLLGIHTLVKRHLKSLIKDFPSLEKKRGSPHTIRNTNATQLLHAGVHINTIRVWLRHISINTTNVYVEVDLEMKARALACCEVLGKKAKKYWRDDKN